MTNNSSLMNLKTLMSLFSKFDYAPYFGFRAENLLGDIADYVREGHGFVMIGGDAVLTLENTRDTH